MLQTGSEGLSKSWISPRHQELRPQIRIWFCSYTKGGINKPRIMTVKY
jgi:hypothetical protein